MNIYTSRLNLKPVSKNDLQAVHDLHLLPQTNEFNTLGVPKNIIATQEIIKNWVKNNELTIPKSHTFVIETTLEKQFVGLIGINLGKEKYKNAEVWFKIHPLFWNNGFATESLKAVLEFGFQELKLHRIEAGCAIENTSSVKVLEKVGMQREAHTRKLLPLATGWSDNYGYAILSTD